MPETAKYSTVQALRDGRPVKIRALKPEDRADLLAAIDRTSAQSLYRRFFAVKRGFSETEETFFLNIDFVNHVALVAVMDEDGRPAIVGGGRYVVTRPGEAEVAFVVVDAFQGQGIGALLTQHLAGLARRTVDVALKTELLAMVNDPLHRTTLSGITGRLRTLRYGVFGPWLLPSDRTLDLDDGDFTRLRLLAQQRVAERFNIRLGEMTSDRRARAVARPRQVAMYLAKQLTMGKELVCARCGRVTEALFRARTRSHVSPL